MIGTQRHPPRQHPQTLHLYAHLTAATLSTKHLGRTRDVNQNEKLLYTTSHHGALSTQLIGDELGGPSRLGRGGSAASTG